MNDQILIHHGIKGQRWGVRRFQNKDGSLTAAGKNRRSKEERYEQKRKQKVALGKELSSVGTTKMVNLRSGVHALQGVSTISALLLTTGVVKSDSIGGHALAVGSTALAAMLAYRTVNNHMALNAYEADTKARQ